MATIEALWEAAMEMLLALVVFGVLGAITIYGYMSTERSARDRERRD